jgi:glycosyltransferase involved in cell wall biosynthesis
MKLVMINDCAYVGETLIRYLPPEIERVHIKRSRGLLNKTFGLAYKILRSEGDIYHVHYLLQDCYLALKMGKHPVVGHVHGSDLRANLKHPIWSRILRYNLKNCDKILVSTPDVLNLAKQFRIDAEYLPNIVNEGLFYPRPLETHSGKKHVLIASDSNWTVKGTNIAVRALAAIREEVDVSIIKSGADFQKTLVLAESLGLSLNILPRVSHEKLNEYYWRADTVVDRFALGSLGMVSLEAIACGRPVVSFVSSDYAENEDFPLKDVQTEEAIAEAIRTSSLDLWKKEHEYLQRHHNTEIIEYRLMSIYSDLL